MADGVVYGLSLDGHSIRYVGITSGKPQVRLYHHKYDARRGLSRPLHHWIRKHGTDNIVMTHLAYVAVEDLKAVECWWIAYLRSLNYNLLNLTDGGEGTCGWVPSEETRRRIGDANRGKLKGKKSRRTYTPLSDEQREKMSIALTGKPGPNKGKKMSEEQKAKISDSGRAAWIKRRAAA